MATFEDALAARRAHNQRVKHAGKQSARLGRPIGNDDFEIETDALKGPAYMTVAIDRGGPVTVTSARNRDVPAIPGAYIVVEEDRNGVLEIVDYDSTRADQHLGSRAPGRVGPHDHRSGSGLEYIHPTRLLEPGLVHVYGDGTTMFVYVEPFVHEGGKFPGGVLDLTASIPGAGNARMVLVSLDVATNSLQATDGSLVGVPLFGALSASDASAITIADAKRLAGVRLQAGQTAISSEADFFDQREFLATSSNAATSGLGFPIVITSAITMPTNRQLVVHETTVDTGGSLTVEGTGLVHYV